MANSVTDLKKEFKEYLKTIYPNIYEGDYAFLADRDMRIWEFMLLKTNKESERLRKTADKLVTTLGSMPPEEADQIVLNIAYLIYTEMLGLKGEIKKTKDIIACAGKESQEIREYRFIESK